MTDAVLEVEDLHCQYQVKEGVVKALNGVGFSLRRGQVLAVVGESGCGKSTLALSILRLLPASGRITSGSVRFEGRDLLAMSEDEIRRLRGRSISMIFQDPIGGLNPVVAIGKQVEEILASHLDIPRRERKQRVVSLLRQVGLPQPERLMVQYPFHLSGGMCQRVMIAIATALDPAIVIADEPTSSLDVTVQAQILAQLNLLRKQRGTAIMLITHDLGVVAQMADWVAVMYAGSIVEAGSVETIFHRPQHPYTWALLSTLPRIDEPRPHLRPIPGTAPSLIDLPDKCPFLPRCSKALRQCREEAMPRFTELADDHRVACYNPIFQDWIAAD